MGKLDDMRRAAAAGGKPKHPPPTVPPKPGGKKPHGPPPVNVLFTCGHKTTVKDLQNRVCPKCVGIYRRDARKRERDKRRRPAKHPDHRSKPRLPDGSEFKHMVYHAEPRPHWTGELHVPGCPAFGPGQASSAVKLMALLDDMYRAHVGWTPAPRTPPPAPEEPPCSNDSPTAPAG